MERKIDFITEIIQKQNFEKILLNIKESNKCRKLNNIPKILENNKDIEESLKRAIYKEIFDYVEDNNKALEKEIKYIYVLGIQETIKKLHKDNILEKNLEIGEYIKETKEGKKMNEIKKFIKNIKGNGIIRKLDTLGRLVMPIDYRKSKVIDGKTAVEVYSIGKYVIVETLEENKMGKHKKFDRLGRVVIPVEIRNKLKWNKDDEIKIWDCSKYFILQKVKKECVFCGKEKTLIEYKQEVICEECKKELAEI